MHGIGAMVRRDSLVQSLSKSAVVQEKRTSFLFEITLTYNIFGSTSVQEVSDVITVIFEPCRYWWFLIGRFLLSWWLWVVLHLRIRVLQNLINTKWDSIKHLCKTQKCTILCCRQNLKIVALHLSFNFWLLSNKNSITEWNFASFTETYTAESKALIEKLTQLFTWILLESRSKGFFVVCLAFVNKLYFFYYIRCHQWSFQADWVNLCWKSNQEKNVICKSCW